MPGRMEFSFDYQSVKGKTPKKQQGGFNIVILGDFSADGDGQRELKPICMDLDNFDSVLQSLSPQLNITLPIPFGENIQITINDLDDFHPDQLYLKLDLFKPWRELRVRLLDPPRFAAAASELQQMLNREINGALIEPEPAVAVQQADTAAGEGGLFDQLLQDRPATLSTDKVEISPRKSQIDSFLQKVISPHVETGADQDLPRLLTLLDEEVAKRMRCILHHGAFQALEANWRSLYETVTRLELNLDLKLYVLDLSQNALAQSLSSDSLQDCPLYSMLVEQAVQRLDGEPWALLAGLYYFGDNDVDMAVLQKMAALSEQAGGPFLSAPATSLLSGLQQGNLHCAQAWQTLRSQENARHLGLILPRLLLRTPYGQSAEEIEQFRFEELEWDRSGLPQHADYLWGNGALGAVILLGQGFSNAAWQFRPEACLDLGDLPFHSYKHDGEAHMKPCAEVFLTEREGQELLQLGFIPLLSYRNRNGVRLMGYQSLSSSGASIQGQWG
ncbi:MAG: type VI secretion system contractile sheath large subunit [Gammaproteobacteria bacterium]|nr:type VI secretion system contractile sheath large subunit [Gammaproteobacteria bacterium]MDH5800979.1 type VI secretion system contractile sheath large subunit [Gammaproteobacteria bacterium]